MDTPLANEVEDLAIAAQDSTVQMSAQEKYDVVRSIGEECIRKEELMNLLAKKPQPICYDGFEPSGRMHIAQGVLKVINVNKLTSAGCKVKIWIADWFAQLNNKMGGDLEKIRIIGLYLIEIWKAAGMNLENVEFLWSSDEINSRAAEYWTLVMDIARRNNLPRISRCCQIMGRNEQDELTAAQIFYPCMQCADIFFLKADICQLGMDQRKVNMLAREYCDDIKRKNKPIILSHHMLPGLREGQEKMSKSDQSSSIFMEDEEEDVNVKIENAFCPPDKVEGNPCLEYVKYLILPWFHEFKVKFRESNNGEKTFLSFKELEEDYKSGNLDPADLKPAIAKSINKILQPVRAHFKDDPTARDLLVKVKIATATAEPTMDASLAKEVEALEIAAKDSTVQMSAKEKYDIVRSIGEECTLDEELMNVFVKKPQPICYDGFEPSGRMHIAQGVLKAINVKKLTSAGCKVKILIADLFALLNNKMGGDLKKIKKVGEYLIEIWKALGMMKHENVEFLWASDVINSRADEYWPLVMDIARRNKLPRIQSCRQIMGRNEQDEVTAAQIFYPCMQCADIIFLKADICQMGMDQKEVNVLAREYCDDTERKNKPAVLSHHMLPDLREGQEKMTKSDPSSSSIFMEDEEADVKSKINKAFCPPEIVEGNPCLEYCKYIIFPWFNEFTVQRSEKNGGEKTFLSFEELEEDYKSGKLHPADLKSALAKSVNKILQPVRDHFKNDPKAKDLLTEVKGFVKKYRVTR